MLRLLSHMQNLYDFYTVVQNYVKEQAYVMIQGHLCSTVHLRLYGNIKGTGKRMWKFLICIKSCWDCLKISLKATAREKTLDLKGSDHILKPAAELKYQFKFQTEH